jgi:hypothetical protein
LFTLFYCITVFSKTQDKTRNFFEKMKILSLLIILTDNNFYSAGGFKTQTNKKRTPNGCPYSKAYYPRAKKPSPAEK